MNPISFDFGNAISHFSKTGGPAGFIWKFALGYALISCLVQGFSVWLQWPLYETYIEMFASGGDFETCVDLFVRDKILNGLEWHAIHHSDKKPLAALRENLEKLNLKDSAAYCHSKISESFLLGEEGES